MSKEEEEHGAKEYPVSGKDGQGHGGGVQEEGETHSAHEKDVVDQQKDTQDTKRFLRLFNHIGVKIQGPSTIQLSEFEPSEETSTVMEQFLKEIKNEKSSTPPREETLRIFQKIVTDPKSVCSVLQVNNVTYVFILVESSPDDESFAASIDGHDEVLALIYDATNKRFVLVLLGDIEDSSEWKQKIHTTVYNIIVFIYGRVYKPAVTDFPSNLPNCCLKIMYVLNADATEAVLRDMCIRKRIAKSLEQRKLYERPPVQSEMLSITDGNSRHKQQQQPHQQPQHEQRQQLQQQPQPTFRPNGVQLIQEEPSESRAEHGGSLMVDEVPRERSLNQRKKKFGESETTSDEQTVSDMLGNMNCT